MSKFIGKGTDRYDNTIYVTNFNENEVEFTTDIRKTILLSDDDKKTVGKVLKKNSKSSIKYIKLEKFKDITNTTLCIIREYKHHFLNDVAKFARKKDDMSLECIALAQTELNGVNTFKEFGEIASKYIRFALGFHPELVHQYKNQIPLMWEFLPEARYIGEVGLDFVDTTYKNEQIEFFSELIERCRYDRSKIITILTDTND